MVQMTHNLYLDGKLECAKMLALSDFVAGLLAGLLDTRDTWFGLLLSKNNINHHNFPL